jgi:carboxyl-terminal processing protease
VCALAAALVSIALVVPCETVSPASAAVSAKEAPAAGGATATLDTLDFLELEIVYTTVVARYYENVNPRTLVDGARNGIAAYLGEVGLEDARLPFTPVRVSAGDGEDLVDTLVLKQLARYGKRLDGHRLVQATVAGELAALRDPYSLLFRPQAFKKFNAFLGNETFGGIGAVLSVDENPKRVIVDRVLPDSPAEHAGLLRGDEILAIDGRDARDLGGAGLRDALRGKIGTAVVVVYSRATGSPLAGTRREASLTIVRGHVRDPEVRTARFGDTGYLALSRFGDRAGAELTAALRDFKSDGVRAIVLDLRANGGGYGDEATAVASAFVTGPVFTTRERGGATTVAAATGKPTWTGPLAVLVDGDTASAAEIVAGAIQDDGAGTLVGTRTFGKGVVQSVFPLPDGSAVKLTTARYTTPNGRDIDKVGITPDTVVAEPPGSTIGVPEKDAQLARALEVVRSAAVTPPSSSGIPSRCSHAQLGGSRAGPCYNRGL